MAGDVRKMPPDINIVRLPILAGRATLGPPILRPRDAVRRVAIHDHAAEAFAHRLVSHPIEEQLAGGAGLVAKLLLQCRLGGDQVQRPAERDRRRLVPRANSASGMVSRWLTGTQKESMSMVSPSILRAFSAQPIQL